MYIPAFKFIQRHTWITALTTTGLFFFLLNIICTPLLNSGDDAFLMYTLGGGYGEPPTQLLHYNYGWHAWLGGIIKNLFISFPGINWYTIALLFFHIAGCSIFFYVLLKKMKPAMAFFFFIIFFFFIETRLLLSLTFTGAAFVAAAGASVLLMYQLQNKKPGSGNTILALILLLLAGMLRLHIIWVVIFLFIPAAATILKKQGLLNWIVVSAMIIAVLAGLNKIHEQYYKQHITGWQQQEKFRQALFYAYNRTIETSRVTTIFKDTAEQQLFFAGFLYDSSRFTSDRVAAITKNITRRRWMNSKDDRLALYWLFIEIRIYILLFAIVIFFFLLQREYTALKKWLFSFLAVAAVYGYLFVFLKTTTTIHLGLLMVLWQHLALHFNRETFLFPQNRKIVIASIIAFLALFGWMGVRVAKENKLNLNRRERFLCSVAELNQSPRSLFVATDDNFPLGYFYIWDTPKQYPVKNLLYKDRLLTLTYLQTLKRFNIINLQEALLHNKNIFLLGNPLPALGNQFIKTSEPLPAYRCLKVRQLKTEE